MPPDIDCIVYALVVAREKRTERTVALEAKIRQFFQGDSHWILIDKFTCSCATEPKCKTSTLSSGRERHEMASYSLRLDVKFNTVKLAETVFHGYFE